MIRRIFSLITLLFLLSFVTGARAQNTLTVYKGTEKSPYAPLNILGGNFAIKSQYVIPAKDLYTMIDGYITKLSYCPRKTSSGALSYESRSDVSIYIKEVDYTQMSELETVTDVNLVFKGKISANVNGDQGSMSITLDKPYHYMGGNLLIASDAPDKISSVLINFFGSNVTNACYAYEKNIVDKVFDFIPTTTFVYYAAPTLTSVVTSPTTASIRWNSELNKYKLRYASVEFFDDFEDGISKWTVKHEGDGNESTDWRQFWGKFSDNVAPHSGVHSLLSRSYSDKAYNVDNWIISPKVKLNGTLKYWVRDDGRYHEHYDVYVSTTTADLNQFSILASPGDATSEWTEVSIDLSSFNGQEGYIAFRNTDCDKDYLQIDDVGIFPPESSWNEVTDVTNPYTLDDLKLGASYAIQVRGVIKDDYETSWSTLGLTIHDNPVPADAVVKPTAYTASMSWVGYGDSYDVEYRSSAFTTEYFHEDFETNIDSWKLVNCDKSTKLSTDGAANHTGKGGFSFHYSKTPPQDLISPELKDIPEGAKLKFYCRVFKKVNETFAVGYSSTTNDITAFTFDNEIKIGRTDWVCYDSPIPAGTKYICIRYLSDYKYYLYIDDLSIYKYTEEGKWNEINDITEPATTIKGLAAETKYDFIIRSKKGQNTTAWSFIDTFTTDKDYKLNNLFTGENQWATYVPAVNMTIPEGLTAYTVSSLGNTSANAEPVDYLPKGVPVLIKRDDTTVNTYGAEVCAGTGLTGQNLLKVADSEHQPTAQRDFVLYNDEFVLVSGGTLTNGLVYLSVPNVSTARAYTRSIVIGGSDDDDTTGIDTAPTLLEGNAEWFDLSGRRLQGQPTRKGIYIQNGKKVVVR